MKILFFDTETTGVSNFKAPPSHPTQPFLMQLGALLVDSETQEDRAKLSLLCKPDIWKAVDPGAERVHGLSAELCDQYGVPSSVALLLFNNLVMQADRIVCHNTAFDLLIMRAMAHRLEKPDRTKGKDTFCTMTAYTGICKLPGTHGGYKWPKLSEAYFHVFGENFEGAHDALSDVIPTKAIYFELTDAQRSEK
jgi:DNA polymerase III epsilon subunit-like protein